VLRGLQAVQAPVAFNFWGVVLGLMGHMMNSIILGFIFAALFARGSRAGAPWSRRGQPTGWRCSS